MRLTHLHKGIKDIAGQRFGRWIVLSYVGNSKWLCKCDCGTERVVNGGHLKAGNTKSCGCLKSELSIQRFTVHGHTSVVGGKRYYSPTYQSWRGMIDRCKSTSARHKDYFDRGITVCDRWKQFENFLSDMGERPVGLTIERKNNDKGYEPGNCCWATYKEQRANRRDSCA